jgi:hypothetical protein
MPVPQPEDNSIFQFAGRNYSRFAIENKIHCIPIDEVCPGIEGRGMLLLMEYYTLACGRADESRRKKGIMTRSTSSYSSF